MLDYSSSDRGSESTRRLAARTSVTSDRASEASSTRVLLKKDLNSKDKIAAWRLRIHRSGVGIPGGMQVGNPSVGMISSQFQ